MAVAPGTWCVTAKLRLHSATGQSAVNDLNRLFAWNSDWSGGSGASLTHTTGPIGAQVGSRPHRRPLSPSGEGECVRSAQGGEGLFPGEAGECARSAAGDLSPRP